MNTKIKASKNTYNKPGFYIFLSSTVFSTLWVGWFMFFNNRVDLGEYKGQEASFYLAKKSDQSKNNSSDKFWVSTENLIAKGTKVYNAQCAVCHGTEGRGDGTPGLIPPPRNFVKGDWKQGGTSKDLFVTLQKGIEGSSMISFQHLSKEDRWALVHYIRSITNNKVLDDKKALEEFATQAQ